MEGHYAKREVHSRVNSPSTQHGGKRIGKPNARARRSSRRLQEYNQKKAISVIRNSLADRMQSSIKSLVESHKRAFLTRQQYYRGIIWGLHRRLENKDRMIAKLGVCCNYLYGRLKKIEFSDSFLSHCIAKFEWNRSGLTREEILSKVDLHSEAFASERRAFPRKKLPKQRVVPICTDAIGALPGEVEARVAMLRIKHATENRGALKVSARNPASKVNRVSGESSSTQRKTVSIPPVPQVSIPAKRSMPLSLEWLRAARLAEPRDRK